MPAKVHTDQMDQISKRLLFSTFLDAVQAFYEDPENKRRFEEWQKRRCQDGRTPQTAQA